MGDGDPGKSDMRGGGNCDHRAGASAVKNCGLGTGTENLQADANGQMFFIRCRGNPD